MYIIIFLLEYRLNDRKTTLMHIILHKLNETKLRLTVEPYARHISCEYYTMRGIDEELLCSYLSFTFTYNKGKNIYIIVVI